MAVMQTVSQKDVGQGLKGRAAGSSTCRVSGRPATPERALASAHEAPADRMSGHVSQAPSTLTRGSSSFQKPFLRNRGFPECLGPSSSPWGDPGPALTPTRRK